MKRILEHASFIVNTIASLLAIFGITVVPFFLDLNNPAITIPLAVALLLIGAFLGYRLREKIADTEVEKEIAIREYEEKKKEEELNKRKSEDEEKRWNSLISDIKHMEYEKKLYLYGVIRKGFIEVPENNYSYESLNAELESLFYDGLVEYEYCDVDKKKWSPTQKSLDLFEKHSELFSSVKEEFNHE